MKKFNNNLQLLHKFYLSALTAALFVTVTVGQSNAQSMTFTDNTLFFPGYESITPWGAIYTADEYGTPKVASLTVDWDNSTGNLNQIIINLHTSTQRQYFDSLFINTDFGDGDTQLEGWDYLVHSGGQTHAGDNSGTTPGDGLWSVSDNYLYTYNTAGGRKGHATGIDAGSLGDTALSNMTGIHNLWTISYDFTSLNIHIGNTFSIAYSPWCANDVILVSSSPEPVPEPRTLLLFGTGLACLIGGTIIRKRKR